MASSRTGERATPVFNTQLKDFIYLDIDRVRSFVAQLYQGVPETLEEKRGTEKTGKSDLGLDVPGLVRLGIGGEILYQRSASETRSAHHHLYNLFEQRLVELDKLLRIDSGFERSHWTPGVLCDGKFTLVHGRAQVIDYRSVVIALQMIPRIAEIARVFRRQALDQQLQDGKITQAERKRQDRLAGIPDLPEKDVQQIGEIIGKLYAGVSRVKVFPYLDDIQHCLTGTTTHEYFSTVPFNPIMSSGQLSSADWYVMGILNAATPPPDMLAPKLAEKRSQNIEDSLEQTVFAMQELSKLTLSVAFPAVSIVPIAIYRPC
jgi:hypothetical protein